MWPGMTPSLITQSGHGNEDEEGAGSQFSREAGQERADNIIQQIRGQDPGYVITLDQSEGSLQVT